MRDPPQRDPTHPLSSSGQMAPPSAPGLRKIARIERRHKQKAAMQARRIMAARGEVPTYNVRAARVPDLAIMTDAWLTSYKFSPAYQGVPADVYRIEQRERVRRLVTRSKALCAVDDEDDTRVTGWIVFEPPRSPGKHVILHYVSVHPSLQNLGLGSALVRVARSVGEDQDAPMFCTHYTFPMRRLVARWNLIYNPYLLEVRPDDYP